MAGFNSLLPAIIYVLLNIMVMEKELLFNGERFALNQCEDIWQWFATSKVYEFTYFYDRVVFHAPNDYFYGAYKNDLSNYVRI